MYVQTTDVRVVRDTESKALLAANSSDLIRVRAERSRTRRGVEVQKDIEAKISTMDAKIAELQEVVTDLKATAKTQFDQIIAALNTTKVNN